MKVVMLQTQQVNCAAARAFNALSIAKADFPEAALAASNFHA